MINELKKGWNKIFNFNKVYKIYHKNANKILFELECESLKTCLETAVKQGADLRWANLRYANLRGANLQGANLQGAYLRRADLRNANLRYADLRYADLRGADLRGADLQISILQMADLRGADLRYADLRYANLQDADLRDADLRDVKNYNQNETKKETEMKTNYENAMAAKEKYEAIKKELEVAKAKMNKFKEKTKEELEWILNDEK